MTEAYKQGMKDYKDGKDLLDNPYTEGSVSFDEWETAYFCWVISDEFVLIP
jgi:hypothetical protein